MLGYVTIDYDQARFPFAEIVERHVALGLLERLHEHFEIPERVVQETEQKHEVYRLLYGIGAPFLDVYREFVQSVVARIVGPSIVVQSIPNFRVQFPGSIAVYDFHRDTDNNHPPTEISFWVPLTEVGPTNTLWLESDPGLGDHHPAPVQRGQVLVFDCAGLSHGNQTSREDTTRVSFDFRAVRTHTFEDSDLKSVNYGMRFRIGEYYEKVEAS